MKPEDLTPEDLAAEEMAMDLSIEIAALVFTQNQLEGFQEYLRSQGHADEAEAATRERLEELIQSWRTTLNQINNNWSEADKKVARETLKKYQQLRREQPDPVCRCGRTSEGICFRCGQNMDLPTSRMVPSEEIASNPNLSLRAEDYLKK